MAENPEYYTHPQETWDEKKCRKAANHTAKDGMGTPYPFKGYIGSHQTGYGKTKYNGGTTINGKWYQGEIKPLPQVTTGFKIITVPTWGFRIVHDQ